MSDRIHVLPADTNVPKVNDDRVLAYIIGLVAKLEGGPCSRPATYAAVAFKDGTISEYRLEDLKVANDTKPSERF